METSQICIDDQRRKEVRAKHLNGLDYLEVSEDQLTLTVYFLGKAPEHLTTANVRIDGGVRIKDITVTGITFCREEDPQLDDCMKVRVDKYGDFSTYTLRLVKGEAKGKKHRQPEKVDEFDPLYSQIDFTFKAGCPSDLDCKTAELCPPELVAAPEINYLAKDYASFRQLILDRLSAIMPDWTERHIPDIGVTLVELFAYVGDYLSYYQDAVATEAYLDTARRRISVRRHTRLVDYTLHEGCNARAWVCVETEDDQAGKNALNPEDIFFVTNIRSIISKAGTALGLTDLDGIQSDRYEAFEAVTPNLIELFKAHNRIYFYNWGNQECCLPRGATSATLKDDYIEETGSSDKSQAGKRQAKYQEPPASEPGQEQQQTPRRKLNLRAGDVLIFEEIKGPKTGDYADADPKHRHAVRLTQVEPDIDKLYNQPIVTIDWALEDALPFPLCLSAMGPAPDCCPLEDVSVARGNVILVDHGRTIDRESFSVEIVINEQGGCEGVGEPRERDPELDSNRPQLLLTPLIPDSLTAAGPSNTPRLARGPLTFRVPFPTPRSIARQQARLLDQVMNLVSARVMTFWHKAQAGESLTQDEANELAAIMGTEEVVAAGLGAKTAQRWYLESPSAQSAAIGKLLADEERLLAKKRYRINTLRERARAEYVLQDTEAREIVEMFGEVFTTIADDLKPSSVRSLGPASTALDQDPHAALPCISLTETRVRQTSLSNKPEEWAPRPDLLASNATDRHFVVEMDNDSRALLRFGDGELGKLPVDETRLEAIYRVGNGAAGNVGAESIAHLVFKDGFVGGAGLSLVRNPIAAQGGAEAEALSEAKLLAPTAYRRKLERAITADDYAGLTEQNQKVQKAAGSLRWTGSWYEAHVAIDPVGTETANQDLLDEIEGFLYRYRRIGHDLSVLPARYVPLDIQLDICVKPHYLRGHVEGELNGVFSNGVRLDGRRGFFHPDNLTFGEGIYLSSLVSYAQAVEGVESVVVSRLRRLFEQPNQEIEKGVLPLSPFEVAQLDNDPNFPERGRLKLNIQGGR
jgi:predicted phage baseplate assembly protein